MKQSVINFKVDPEIKDQVEEIFGALGMNTSQALKIFLRQVIYNKGIPFEIKLPNVPNEETLQAMQDAEEGNVVQCESMDDLFEQLESE